MSQGQRKMHPPDPHSMAHFMRKHKTFPFTEEERALLDFVDDTAYTSAPIAVQDLYDLTTLWWQVVGFDRGNK